MAVNLGGNESEGINEINITPFVDIVLVLLIIFMISTPALIYKGLRVSLPTATTPDSITHVTLKLMVTKEGKIYLDNKEIDNEGIKRAFVKLRESKAKSDALISADKEVSHGTVMELSDFLRNLGVQQIGFATVAPGTTETKK